MEKQEGGWTLARCVNWAFGPQQLLQVGSLVMQARVRLSFLKDVPDDDLVRKELTRLAGAIVHRADTQRWYDLGDYAGAMVRLLRTRPLDERTFQRLESSLTSLEALVNARMVQAA
ncbi:MAG TPA: hypothetical protein VFK78_04280 [Gemmatimonadales bacterium]|nr:hypothetical protein [Gemmatimonadales bacterium]